MIVAAALRFDHVILSIPQPARHHDILHAIPEYFKDYDLEQGFLLDTGYFVDRKTAYLHAKCWKQLDRREKRLKNNPNAYDGDELFSEDLW